MRYLAGHLLMFAGLGWVVLCLFYSGRFPATPFWVFVCAALVGSVPLMVVGGRLGHRGTLPTDATAEETRAEYARDTFRFAVVLGYLFACGFLAALPIFVMGAGVLPWNPNFITAWYVAVILVVALVTRPLYFALDRRAMWWWSRRAAAPTVRPPGAPRPAPLKEPVARRVLPRVPPSDHTAARRMPV